MDGFVEKDLQKIGAIDVNTSFVRSQDFGYVAVAFVAGVVDDVVVGAMCVDEEGEK